MMTLETLRQFGADTATGMGRCMNNEAFYLRLVNLALSDKNFDKLAQSLNAGDTHAAFEAAHALKGALGNLSLTPLYDPASALTELLRDNGSLEEAARLSEEIFRQKEALAKLAE